MDSFYEREMREMERFSKMTWSKMEIDSFYREHVCDSNLLEFPCPCRICKRMITIDEFNHRLCCTCDRQADIEEGKCSFIIHKSCTKTIPRQVSQHPFHPEHDFALSSGHHLSSSEHQDICNACGDDLKMGFVYKCSTPDCSFALDVKCAFLTLSNNSIDHHGHPHRLFSCNEGKYFSYSCTCCKLPFTDVDRAETSLLVCLECKALLHKSCAEIPRKIEKHPFHPSLSLDLLPRVPYPGPCFKCNLCRQTKQDGFAYQCVECGIFLDVRCASLKPKRKNGDGDGDDSQQLRHFHPLIVCEDEKDTFPRTCYTCGACGHPFRDGDKMYFCPDCDCLLDQSCAEHFTQDFKHVLHPEHKLTFWYRPLLSGYRKCQACSSSIGDSGYQCFTCAFYLDIKCAMSKPTILHDSADRKPLVLHEAADRRQRCKVCKKQCDTSFFRRLGGDFVVHVDCMTNFPAEIQSSHQHRLTLRGLKEGFQETFFCVVCQKIEGKSPHYSCQICPTPYNAHPHCVVNELSEKMTFQDFKDSFNKDQKMEVDIVLQAYGRKDKPNWLYDSHTATKNIWMSNQTLIRTPWEYWDAESEVIETDTGIYILKVFAPLLNALVNKYPHFCSGSTLSQLPKMFFVTTVCEVLYNMSITDVKDVTKDMLLTWFQGFALGKHAGLDMAFAFDRLLRVATTHFGLHAGLFIDPNFAKVGDDEVAERRAPVTHSPIISLGKFELHDELKELGKQSEELEKTPKGKRSTYEWKKEWLTDTLDLLREKAFVIDS